MARSAADARLLPALLDAVAAAGERIMEARRHGLHIDTKGDGSPVTNADFASNRCLVDHLKRLTPEWPVFSEESGHLPFNIRGRWRHYWLIDPLDGTRAFVNGTDEFSINVALIRDGEPVIGVIAAPADGRVYFATQGGPARRCLPGHADETIACAVPGTRPRVVISHSDPTPETVDYLEQLGEHSVEYLDSSLKSCRVAEGGADLYARLGPTGEWDTAAAQCLLEAAGGGMVDCHGRRLAYNTRSSVMNPYFIAYGATPERWLAPLAQTPS